MTRTDRPGPHAVLIDLDGTLVDTVEVWRTAYLGLAADLGTELPEEFWPSIAGRSMQGSLQVLGPAATAHDPDQLIERLGELAAEHLREGGGTGWSWLPGAQELLEVLRVASDAPATGLVTSAWHTFADPLLAIALPGRTHIFGAIVCGDDVARPKPAPDAYLLAAELLGVEPTDCLVIEDSPTGVAAAESAGMVVLAVPHAGPVAAAPGRAVRDHLGGITCEDLVALYARLRSGASS